MASRTLDFERLATTSVAPRYLRAVDGPIASIMQRMRTGIENGKEVDIPRTIVTPEQLFEWRLTFPNEHDRQLLRDKEFFLACAAIGDPDSNEVVIGLYQEPLVKEMIDTLNPEHELVEGSLPVSGAVYTAIKRNGGFVIKSDVAADLQHENYPNHTLHSSVRRDAFAYMAGGRNDLIEENLALTSGTIEKSMALHLVNVPGMRLIYFENIGFGQLGAGGDVSLDENGPPLLGVEATMPSDVAFRVASRIAVPNDVSGLVDTLYQGLNESPGVKGVTRALLKAQLAKYEQGPK